MPDLIDESPRALPLEERVASLEREVSRLELALSDTKSLLEVMLDTNQKER